MWEHRDKQTKNLVHRTGYEMKKAAQEIPLVLTTMSSEVRELEPFVTGAGLEPLIYSVSHRANRNWLLGTVESGVNPAQQAERVW